MLGIILLIILIAVLLGSIPVWPYSRNWGYTPFGILLALLLMLFFMGFLPIGKKTTEIVAPSIVVTTPTTL